MLSVTSKFSNVMSKVLVRNMTALCYNSNYRE